jgi:uncharacterized membrane protein
MGKSMEQVVDWIFDNAWAIVIGSIVFVLVGALIVWVAKGHDGPIETDSEDGFPG